MNQPLVKNFFKQSTGSQNAKTLSELVFAFLLAFQLALLCASTTAAIPEIRVTSVRALDGAGRSIVRVVGVPFQMRIGWDYANPGTNRYRLSWRAVGRTNYTDLIDWGKELAGTTSRPHYEFQQWTEIWKEGPVDVAVEIDPDNRIGATNQSLKRLTARFSVLTRTNFYDFSVWREYLAKTLPNNGRNSYAWLAMESGQVIASGAVGGAAAPWDANRLASPVTLDSSIDATVLGHMFFRFALHRLHSLSLGTPDQFNLNDSVEPYLREINPNVHPGFKRLTFVHLLEGQTGLPAGIRDLPSLQNVLPQAPLFPPGSKSDSDETGPHVLAMLIERLSGMSYPDFMQQECFAKLGMQNTFSSAVPPAQPITYGWHSSVNDIARFFRGFSFSELVSPHETPELWFNGWNWWYSSYPIFMTRQANGVHFFLLMRSLDVAPWDVGVKLPPLPRFKESPISMARENGNLVLSKFMQAGTTYTWQRISDLGKTNRVDIQTVVGSNQVHKFFPLASGSKGFFNVRSE